MPPGLDNRLRQHGRRAGVMVGLSMALTIAVCIGSFVWIYAQVEPVIGDFVDAATIAPTTAAQATGEEEPEEEPAEQEPTEQPNDEETPEPENEEPNVVDPTDEEPEPTPTPEEDPDEFEVTHIVSSEVPINFRPGPGVNSGAPVGNSLAPGTQLQYLDDTQPSQDPNTDGDTAWMNFRLEDGREGWIRQIDVDSVNAGQ